MESTAELTGRERKLAPSEFIVSKTDPKGLITYVNRVFIRIAGYSELELLGQPHNVIRHPGMPRAVFKLLWNTIRQKNEIFALVINRCNGGDHYWVFAHVTASVDGKGNITGYHSNRRAPKPSAVSVIEPIYELMLAEERRHPNPASGLRASGELLGSLLSQQGVSYDEFIFSIC